MRKWIAGDMNEHKEYALVALYEMLDNQQIRSASTTIHDIKCLSILNRSIEEEFRIQEAIKWVERQTGE